MAENKEEKTEAQEPEAVEAPYVSDQLALRIWSVLARDLHEGDSIVLLEKAWDSQNEEFVVFPTYADQNPDAIQPDVWMTWRHELKAPLAGHTRIRDYAEVVDAIPVTSKAKLARLEPYHGLHRVEAERRFDQGEPGLVALVLRVYHLSRAYKFDDVANKEGDGPFAPLPFDVDLDDLSPVLDDADFERYRAAVKSALA